MSIVSELTSRDQEFVASIRKDISSDLEACRDLTPARQYEIYREAFDKIVGYVSAYRPLLTSIKAEYDEIVESILRGHREAQSLEMKVEAIAAVRPNLQNYKRRCNELESRIAQLKLNNQRMRDDCERLRAERQKAESDTQEAESADQEAESAKKEEEETPKMPTKRRLPPGMSVEDVTDSSSLAAEKARVERELRQLQEKARSQYVSLERKEELTRSLLEKIQKKEEFEKALIVERLRRQLLTLATESAQKYQQSQPFAGNVAAAVLGGLRDLWPQRRRRPTCAVDLPASLDADPTEEKETEKVVEYLEKFQELLAAKDFVAAAYHAANSYRGVLRTIEIFARFRRFESEQPGVLLVFCEALLATAAIYEGRIGEQLSFECAQEALAKDRVDLVEHWVTNDLLSCTEHLGELLANHGDSRPSQAARCFELSHAVHHRAGATFRAVESLAMAGRSEAAVSYGLLEAGLSADAFRRLLQRQASAQLALSLVGYGCLTLNDVVGCFFAIEAWAELAWLVDGLVQRTAQEAGCLPHQAALQLMQENPEIPSSAWRDIASHAPEDMRHLHELLSSSVVYEAVQRSLSSLEQQQLSSTSG